MIEAFTPPEWNEWCWQAKTVYVVILVGGIGLAHLLVYALAHAIV